MSQNTKQPLYSHPMRGLGVIAIFLALGPAVQTIVGSYLFHNWVGGANLLVEIFDVLTKEAWPRILPGYSYYMPSVFLSGIVCSLPPSRGLGLSLSGAIGRTILVSLVIEIFYIVSTQSLGANINSETFIRGLFLGVVQWLFVGWVCWILATGFRLDKPVAENHAR